MWHLRIIDCTCLHTAALEDTYHDWLSTGERRRATDMAHESDATLHLAGRIGIRKLLAEIVGAHPRTVLFTRNPYGKPLLTSPRLQNFDFSISHSWPYALLAVSRGISVGVDIENSERTVDERRIWTRFFSAGEQETLTSLPLHLQRDSFFTLWTLKEACIKASGMGLSRILSSFTIHHLGDPVTMESMDQHEPMWLFNCGRLPETFHFATAIAGDETLSPPTGFFDPPLPMIL